MYMFPAKKTKPCIIWDLQPRADYTWFFKFRCIFQLKKINRVQGWYKIKTQDCTLFLIFIGFVLWNSKNDVFFRHVCNMEFVHCLTRQTVYAGGLRVHRFLKTAVLDPAEKNKTGYEIPPI